MNVTQLLEDLARLGIRLEAHGTRLRYAPRTAVTPDLADRIQRHKHESLAALTGEHTTVCCPCCRSRQLLEGQAGRIWCTDCERVAWWVHEDGEIVRADCLEEQYIDPDSFDPCAKCGSGEQWQSTAGDLYGRTPGRWHCLHCDPPTKARELRELAARLNRQKS